MVFHGVRFRGDCWPVMVFGRECCNVILWRLVGEVSVSRSLVMFGEEYWCLMENVYVWQTMKVFNRVCWCLMVNVDV